eukprot:755248-Hanusia_phi.AAC.7
MPQRSSGATTAIKENTQNQKRKFEADQGLYTHIVMLISEADEFSSISSSVSVSIRFQPQPHLPLVLFSPSSTLPPLASALTYCD